MRGTERQDKLSKIEAEPDILFLRSMLQCLLRRNSTEPSVVMPYVFIFKGVRQCDRLALQGILRCLRPNSVLVADLA